MKILKPRSFGEPLGLYSHGVVAPVGEIVVVAGQVGAAGASQRPPADIVGQTKQAFENVRAVVEAAGCSMRDVVRLQTFLTRADDMPGFMRAREELYQEYFPDGSYPPNTLLVVSRLVRPELLVEIEAMAIRRSRSSTSQRGTASTKSPVRPAAGNRRSRAARPRQRR